MYQTARSICTLARDQSVTPGVTCLTARTLTKRECLGSLDPAFAPAFHAFRNTVSPTFVLVPYRRISDPPKSSIGHPCFLFEGVPPQPNYPPAAVLHIEVRDTVSVGWCYIVDSTQPGSCASMSPTYALQQKQYPNNRI